MIIQYTLMVGSSSPEFPLYLVPAPVYSVVSLVQLLVFTLEDLGYCLDELSISPLVLLIYLDITSKVQAVSQIMAPGPNHKTTPKIKIKQVDTNFSLSARNYLVACKLYMLFLPLISQIYSSIYFFKSLNLSFADSSTLSSLHTANRNQSSPI